jgi:hypothetical protein
MTWWFANPDNTKTETYMALLQMVRGLIDAARLIGKDKIFCFTANRGMMRLLESLNFYNAGGHLILGGLSNEQ